MPLPIANELLSIEAGHLAGYDPRDWRGKRAAAVKAELRRIEYLESFADSNQDLFAEHVEGWFGDDLHAAVELTGGSIPAHVPGAYPNLSCCGGEKLVVPAVPS